MTTRIVRSIQMEMLWQQQEIFNPAHKAYCIFLISYSDEQDPFMTHNLK